MKAELKEFQSGASFAVAKRFAKTSENRAYKDCFFFSFFFFSSDITSNMQSFGLWQTLCFYKDCWAPGVLRKLSNNKISVPGPNGGISGTAKNNDNISQILWVNSITKEETLVVALAPRWLSFFKLKCTIPLFAHSVILQTLTSLTKSQSLQNGERNRFLPAPQSSTLRQTYAPDNHSVVMT